MKYAVITENDRSQWKDKTGELYHFPNRYINYLARGTKVIYYKGKLTDKKFEDYRLSSDPHYFGIASVGKVYLDSESAKQDYYAEIVEFNPFSRAVPLRTAMGYYEKIPDSRKSNYWRDGVRPIDKNTYETIIRLSDIEGDTSSSMNDNNQGSEQGHESSGLEGGKKGRYTSYYERNPKLRHQAISIHGLTCMGCTFNFENRYGENGKGYVHVHHVKPISESRETIVNPRTDMIVLCANCHAIVHRDRRHTLTLMELRGLIKK